MSVPMKKPLIKKIRIFIGEQEEKEFKVPIEKARALLLLLNEFAVKEKEQKTPSAAIFKELDERYSRPGSALQGARLRAEMSQVELSEKLGIDQSDLSKMEHGKRPIGKKMAKRLATILDIDYRIFL